MVWLFYFSRIPLFLLDSEGLERCFSVGNNFDTWEKHVSRVIFGSPSGERVVLLAWGGGGQRCW